MRGRHQFRRRFSLQPSSAREENSSRERRSHSPRPIRSQDNDHRLPSTSEDSSDPSSASSSSSAATSVRHKIVVMGAAKVGKSAIIHQFLYGTFSPKYKRTVEEMHHGDFNVAGVKLFLDILDTSGSHEFPAMRALSISSADAFILVYDVSDSETFEEARSIRDEIHQAKGTVHVPIVVVGNKSDLTDEEQVGEQGCDVATKTAETVVTVEWENGFVVASAKNNENISEIFKQLLAQAKVKYNLSPALRTKRRQSLPLSTPMHQSSSSSTSPGGSVNAALLPSAMQLQQLQQLRDRHANKRNSCVIS